MGHDFTDSSVFRAGNSNDRRELQERIEFIERRVRRRLRRTAWILSDGPYDLDDVMSSARRRIDAAATSQQLIFHSEQEFEGYVTTVARRVAYDAIRRRHRQRMLLERSARAKDSSSSAPEIFTTGRGGGDRVYFCPLGPR